MKEELKNKVTNWAGLILVPLIFIGVYWTFIELLKINWPGFLDYVPIITGLAVGVFFIFHIRIYMLCGIWELFLKNTKCWVWYIQPSANIAGLVVKAGTSVIAIAKILKNRYKKGITDHVHVRIHNKNGTKINPITVIK